MTRLSPLLWTALAVCVAGASRAVAQQPDPLVKLDPASRFAIEAMIDSAQVAGLPWRVLLGRAQEGIAKKADNRRIVAAVRERLARLRDARAMLGAVGDQDLGAAAAVLEAGVKPEQLAPLKNPPRGRSLLTALTVLGDLVSKGVPRDEASSAIVKLWQGGAADADFMGLFRGVERDILQGLNPGAALQNQIRQLPGRAP